MSNLRNEDYKKELERELEVLRLENEIEYTKKRMNEGEMGDTNGRYISDDMIKFIINKLEPETKGKEYMTNHFEENFKFYIDIIKRNC